MAYEVFCRYKSGRVFNELYTDRNEAMDKFKKLSEKCDNVSLEKRRKTKLDDSWRK